MIDKFSTDNTTATLQEGWSSLMVSSNYGHIGVVKELANRGAELNLATVRSSV